jgi:hypothetical protein
MKIIKLVTICFLIAGAMTFSNCEKVTVTGPAGEDGKDGNANVVSSSITSGSWSFVSPSWSQSFSYSAITQDILDNGAVLVYVASGVNYYQLPYTFYPTSSYSRTYNYVHYLGGLKVYVTDSDLNTPEPGTLKFKVVVIEASGLMKNPNVDLNNYQAVKKAFNLTD